MLLRNTDDGSIMSGMFIMTHVVRQNPTIFQHTDTLSV